MTEEILALCRAMGADREELLLPLVRAVSDRLAGRLREGASPEDCGPAFPLACAMTAMDRLSGMTGGGEAVTSFTAGDLTIRKESGGAQGGRACPARPRSCWPPGWGTTDFAFGGWRADGAGVEGHFGPLWTARHPV